MTGVTLEKVVKRFGDVQVIHGVDLTVEDGEFCVFVGPSGCGKSTLLRMIAGLEQITGGTLQIDGQVMNDIPPSQRGIAMVFQSYALYPHMTVRQNLAFGLENTRLPRAEIAERLFEMLRGDRVLPERGQVTMTQPFLKAYSELLIQTCHRRGRPGRAVPPAPRGREQPIGLPHWPAADPLTPRQ